MKKNNTKKINESVIKQFLKNVDKANAQSPVKHSVQLGTVKWVRPAYKTIVMSDTGVAEKIISRARLYRFDPVENLGINAGCYTIAGLRKALYRLINK